MSLIPTVKVSCQEPIVEEPEDYSQALRLIDPSSKQHRIARLPIFPTAGEKEEEKNLRGARLIKKIRARQASSFERIAKRAELKKEEEVRGSLLPAVAQKV